MRAGAVSADLAGAWVVATSNIGIGLGAALGGVVLGHGGIRDVAWTAAVAIALAVAVVVLGRGAFGNQPRS